METEALNELLSPRFENSDDDRRFSPARRRLILCDSVIYKLGIAKIQEAAIKIRIFCFFS